jgi:hypothetical protein
LASPDFLSRLSADIEQSKAFEKWLAEHPVDWGNPTIIWEGPLYRIVYGGYDPLAIAGSLAAGGRFNIGGAQAFVSFPKYKMHACLYAASTRACARKEAGEFLGNPEEYELTPQRPLKLWDLKTIIQNQIAYPSLQTLVDATPLAARWVLQKVPKVSQIIGFILKEKGGDGLLHPSTKDRKEKVLAFFVKDDLHTRRLFTVKRLSS